VDKAVHKAVRARAGHRCEYCRFPEAFAELPFHLDHIIARQHGGPGVPDNLALACCYCNRYKGRNLSGSTRSPVTSFRCFTHDNGVGKRHPITRQKRDGRATIHLLRADNGIDQ
jgi:hypothetical protein